MATIFSERLFGRFEQEMGPSADALGISRDIFVQPDVELTLQQYFSLLDHVASHGTPDIGFRIGSSLAVTDIGPLGHAVQAAPSVGEALQLLATYLFVIAHGNVISLHTGNDVVLVTWGYTPLYEGIHQQDVEIASATIRNIVYQLSENSVTPVAVEFTHSRPAHAKELEAFYRCEINFGCRTNRLHYPRACLDLPNRLSDPSLLNALRYYLAERLKSRRIEDDLLQKVRHFITVSLSSGKADISSVAELLGMGRRTLQRRLASDGVVFSELADDIRREHAIEYVRHSEVSLAEVALMLGYSEQSAFTRAYRRWTGTSPKQARDEGESPQRFAERENQSL